jgi:methanogenic corrinoid protein MtbC1
MNLSNPGLRIVRSAASSLLQPYTDALLAGERVSARRYVDGALKAGVSAESLLTDVVYVAMENIRASYREDEITTTQLNLATRLNRFFADMLGSKLEAQPSNGKRALIFCGNDEPEELGGQITADLFQAEGWEVKFAGGGVPDDEVLKLIGDERPDLLVLYATLPSGVPAVRKLIDYLREINSNPEMQIMCCGGIYKRAEGLADEIGADLYAPDALSAVEIATHQSGRRATVDQQTVGRSRRIKKAAQRKSPVLGRIGPAPELPPRAEAV